jgi:SAM-dependent methyltransferase
MLDRYLSRAVDRVLTTQVPADLVSQERRERVGTFRWFHRISEVVDAVNGHVFHEVSAESLPLDSHSIDLCHSGGALEHYSKAQLPGFLAECYRILRPGGIASHVFDHRDHLHHADHHYPFLSHFALSDKLYNRLWKDSLNYHNRLFPREVIELFENAGFEMVCVRRMILPQKRYIEGDEVHQGIPGIQRKFLSKSFRHISEADLRTAAAHYLFRKPCS